MYTRIQNLGHYSEHPNARKVYILFAFHDDSLPFLGGIEMVVTQRQWVSPLLII
jgi:hypothetical protein